jgi:hypothetical protein
MYFLLHKFPIGNHNLADALQRMSLNTLITMTNELHGRILSTQTLYNAATIRIEAGEFAEVVQSNGNNGLQNNTK